jgi:hypothetical protein
MKVTVFIQRYRQLGITFMYGILIIMCVILLYDPSYVDGIVGFFMKSKIQQVHRGPEPTKFPPSTPSPKRTLQKLINLPFTPKNFKCDEMLLDAGRNFTYLETYWDHIDAYKTALGLNNLLELSTVNEHDWILQEISRLPFVKTVCETGFGAGATSFQWLVGNEDVIVYSFDETKQNYSLEMVDFMSIEFPERFFLYPGDLTKMVKTFAQKREGRLKCDIIFIDSTQPADVIRENLKDFRRLANRVENMIVLNAHPRHSPDRDAHRVWLEYTGSGEITEHFRCYFSEFGNLGKETGLTVGSFAF